MTKYYVIIYRKDEPIPYVVFSVEGKERHFIGGFGTEEQAEEFIKEREKRILERRK